jgi:putative ABC transport system permease protein
MSPRAIVREAIRALLRNKLRSSLTVLGITVGIAAVICVVAIGRAGSVQVEEQLNNLCDSFIWIEAGSRTPNGIRSGSHGTKSLLQSDAEAILKQVPLVKLVSANVNSRTQMVYAGKNWFTTYRGVAPEWFLIKRWLFSAGAPFSHTDVDRAAAVCVLGETVRAQLFDMEDPIGTVIRVGTLPCQVMGVLVPRGLTAFGQDQDDVVVMPYTTAQKKLKGVSWLDDIVCSATSPEAINSAIQQISVLLRERHHIRSGQDDDFNIRRPEEFINAQLEARRTFAVLLIAIASVSLLVGGIGIMNVMLVSVTERTREIGVRMSVGATDSDVAKQFLGEAVMLSLFGGLLGAVFGVIASYVLGAALQWPMEIPPQAILVAGLFSVAVGIFFGLYPAWKASKLDPIEALRYE